MQLSKSLCENIDKLSAVDGVLLNRQIVVVPDGLMAPMLTLIHEGHLVIEKCKQRVRDLLYWPNMNKDVYESVSRCDVCRYAQPKVTNENALKADLPWAKVDSDIFFLKTLCIS